MDIIQNWDEIKAIFKHSFKSSFHFSIATVTDKGEPHVTPIGSLILGEPGHGIYFEEFPRQLPINLKTNKQVCVLAVNSSRWFWLISLLSGHFSKPPAIRLYGIAGNVRQATTREIELWQKRVRSVSLSRGHSIMWKNMKTVRDIEFSKIEPVHLGEMTRQSWNSVSAS